jgi:CBS domain-containing protein
MVCRDLLMRVSISDVMQPCSTFVSSRDLVTRARAVMRSSGFRTLPVIDGGRLEGIITAQQIIRITSTRSNIPVAGLMFPPRLIATPASDLAKIAKDMVRLEISNVPVVQSYSDKTVIGLIKLDDILKIVEGMKSKLTIGDIMIKKVVTCERDDEISRVWGIMEQNRYSGVPVTRYDKQKHKLEVIGMVTRSDIIRSGEIRLAEESVKGGRPPTKVRSLMRTPAITVSPKGSLAEAIEVMLKRNVGRLPVVDEGTLVGIVSRSDIVRVACG